jgi:hypothetical protein
MSDELSKPDSKAKLPLEDILSKPVHLMTADDLARYRHELSLLRIPQQKDEVDSQGDTNSPRISPTTDNDEIEPYSFMLFYFFGLPLLIGLIIVVPLLLLIYLLKS